MHIRRGGELDPDAYNRKWKGYEIHCILSTKMKTRRMRMRMRHQQRKAITLYLSIHRKKVEYMRVCICVCFIVYSFIRFYSQEI